jgi:uncharacterized spore protein YtfJ
VINMDEKPDVALERIDEMLAKMNVNAVFGSAYQEGGVTLIPVASVGYAFGYGSGSGRMAGAPAGAEGAPCGPGEGSGQGGGGGGRARPMGYIRVSPEGVTYEPIMDNGRIAILGIAMVMWNVFWITAAIRAFVKK